MKSLESKHKPLKEFSNVNLWLNLPMDQTTNAFLQSIGCSSRQTLESALKQLETLEHPGEETIREEIFPKREVASTTPIPIAWEIANLLKNIFCVYINHGPSEREAFAEEVFHQLVSQGQIAKEDGLEEDYFRMNLLCNEGARNQLLSSIKPAFQRRMDLINSFVYRSVSVEDYEIALEYLDDLIAKLFSGKSGAPNEAVENRSTTCSYPDEVLKFYKDLVSVRNILVPKRTDGLPSDVLYFDQSPICACVVSRMEKILNKYKRPVSAEIATEFLGYYKEYLCLQIDPDKRDKAVNFAKTYNRLSEYIHGDLSVDVFIEEMRNELYSYAKSIFVELRKISLYGFVHTEYTPKAANDAHFRKRLVDTQYAIQKNIDEAIKQLKMAYTIFYYSTQISDEGISIVSLPPMGQAEMDRLSDCMYYQIYALSGTV